jgi:hypothetical protein
MKCAFMHYYSFALILNPSGYFVRLEDHIVIGIDIESIMIALEIAVADVAIDGWVWSL